LLVKRSLGQAASNRESFGVLLIRKTQRIPYRREGHPGVKANLKAVQGDLFMLDKFLFFVSKSPLLIDLNDIYQVVFSRVGAGATGAAGRTFDLKVITKSGPEHTFTSINKSDHEVTEAFLRDKRVKVKNEMVPDADLLLAAVDDDDEEMASISSDDESRGKGREKKAAKAGNEDDSEQDGIQLPPCFAFFVKFIFRRL
jgi:structure-specific recognition protein 1